MQFPLLCGMSVGADEREYWSNIRIKLLRQTISSMSALTDVLEAMGQDKYPQNPICSKV
jgi:hypothetical protein